MTAESEAPEPDGRVAEGPDGWVEPAPRLDGPIVLAEYDPAWPATYAREASRVHEILGSTVLRIEHVGSTSIPGLPAKPIIDILLVVPDTTEEPVYVAPLEARGYRLVIREPDWYEHRVLKGPDANINLHVFPPDVIEIDRMLAFRDHLRTNADARDRYLAEKRRLAAQTWAYVQDYADAKSAVVEALIAEALAGRG